MFHALGQIFPPLLPRQAEQSDTRQDIQRHDPEFERRKKKPSAAAAEEEGGEAPVVAVEALLEFLTAFVKNNPPVGTSQKIETESHNQAVQSDEDYSVAAATTTASRAASAYMNTARAPQRQHSVLLQTSDAAGAGGPEMTLSGADTRTVLALIAELKILRAAQIEQLQLEPAATFLQALVDATSKAKAYL
jgi:hypothetical protein